MRHTLLLVLFLLSTSILLADTIELTIEEGATPMLATLTWMGGIADYAVYRGLDPQTVLAPALLRTTTSDTTWKTAPQRPAPGQVFFYKVVETDLEAGVFPEQWIDGTNCSEPEIQVHAFNADTYILRQSLCTDFEAPFIYMLFGDDEVLIQDTGAGGIDIADTVMSIVDQWTLANGVSSIDILVTHSHGHGDHIAGDSQFQGLPNTTVVGTSQAAVAAFFGITGWPTQIVSRDLGGRIVDIVPIPGHQSAHIALYDRRTGIVLTGDSLYPGRLYVFDFIGFLASISRLAVFVEDKPVPWVLGTHIEMTSTPFQDFPFAVTSHPDERELPLVRGHLFELLEALQGMVGNPVIEPHKDFIVYPL